MFLFQGKNYISDDKLYLERLKKLEPEFKKNIYANTKTLLLLLLKTKLTKLLITINYY